MVSLRSGVTDPNDGQKLDSAIQHLGNSVSASNWTNNSHPTLQGGNTVFGEAANAVSSLVSIIQDTHGPVPNSTVQGFINSIVGAMRQVATIAISDHPSSSHLSSANNELAQGDANASSQPANAIGHYKNAWSQALQ